MNKDVVTIKISTGTDNIEEVQKQVKVHKINFPNIKVNKDEGALPEAVSLSDIRKKYWDAEVSHYVKFDLVNDINRELKYEAAQGHGQASVKVYSQRLTDREKVYIANTFYAYKVRFGEFLKWSDSLGKRLEYDLVEISFEP